MNLPDLLNLFSLPFMQRAILGGLLLGTLGGLLGSFLILRRLSLFGNSVSHAAILGVVLAALLGLPSTLVLIVFTIVYGLGIIYLIDRTNLSSDTVLSIAVSASVALGTIGFTFVEGYRGSLLSILFGDILAISNIDLILLSLLLVTTSLWLVVSLPEQILLTLNEDLAKVKGIGVQTYRYWFIVLLATAIAISIRAVGILLVNSFLVIPAATAKLICQQFIPFLLAAAGIGAMTGVMGMVISGLLNLPSGPSIVLVQLMSFLGIALWYRQG